VSRCLFGRFEALRSAEVYYSGIEFVEVITHPAVQNVTHCVHFLTYY